MIPDAHCHLDQLADPEGALRAATDAGVGPILAVSMDAASAERVLELRARFGPMILAGVGLHPGVIPGMSAEEQVRQLQRIEGLLPQADFVGEIGLDHKDAVNDTDRARQREALELQLSWAAGRRLPVNLHSRRADREVLDSAIGFHQRTGLGALMHWFTRSDKLARACAASGIFVSAGPSVLVDPRTAATAARVDSSILLVETDSPVEYGSHGPASPAWAARVLDSLAETRGVSRHELASEVGRNLARYLGR